MLPYNVTSSSSNLEIRAGATTYSTTRTTATVVLCCVMFRCVSLCSLMIKCRLANTHSGDLYVKLWQALDAALLKMPSCQRCTHYDTYRVHSPYYIIDCSCVDRHTYYIRIYQVASMHYWTLGIPPVFVCLCLFVYIMCLWFVIASYVKTCVELEQVLYALVCNNYHSNNNNNNNATTDWYHSNLVFVTVTVIVVCVEESTAASAVAKLQVHLLLLLIWASVPYNDIV